MQLTHHDAATARRIFRRAVVLLTASVASAALVACGDDSPADPRAVSAILPTRQASDVSDEVVRNAAEAMANDRCVRRHGFDPPPAPTLSAFSADAAAPTVETTPYGPRTVKAFLAAVDVIRHPKEYAKGGVELAAADRKLSAFSLSLSVLQQERYTKTVFGDENDPKAKVDLRGPEGGGGIAAIGGCLGEAYRTLYTTPAAWVTARELIGSLPREVRRRVRDTASYRSAINGWRACVRGKGLAAMSFDTASKLAAQAPTGEARAIARLVIACRSKAGIDRAVQTEERQIADVVVKQYEGDLLGYLEMRQRGTDKARAVLAESVAGQER